jgi:hypothetical protein
MFGMIWTGYKTPHPVTFELNVTGFLKARIVEFEEKALARQWLCKHVPVATNTLTAMEKLLDMMHGPYLIKYSKCSERKVHDYFFPGLLVCNVNA